MNSLCSSIAVNPFNDNEIIATFSNYGVISVFHTLNANSATPPTWDAIEGPASGDCHVRFCERLGLKCACLLDASITRQPALQHITSDIKAIVIQAIVFQKQS